jgi:hypothetical protein
MEVSTVLNRNCKECFNYTPQTLIVNCCDSKPLCNQYSTFSTCGATSSSLLEAQQLKFLSTVSGDALASTLIYNQVNSTRISAQLYGQLEDYGANRFNKYRRPAPMVIPQSVIDLDMNTRNIGVPLSNVFSCKDPLTLQINTIMQPTTFQSSMNG